MNKKHSIIFISALGIFFLLYCAPFIATHRIKNAIIKNDKMAFNAATDFSSIEESIEHEFSKQIDAEISNLSLTSQREMAKDLAQEVGNTSKLFDTAIFSLFKIRHDSIETNKRYLSIDRFHVSFDDNNRPFLYPEWILCREKIVTWKLCEIHLQKRAFDINKEPMAVQIPSTDEAILLIDPEYLITDNYIITNNLKMFLAEAFNILDAAYGYRKSSFDKEDNSLIFQMHNHEYKVKIKSAFMDDKYEYLIIDKIEKENDVFPDCHACPGNLSIIRYTIDKKGLRIEDVFDDFAQTGVWGNSGTVVPIIYDNKEGMGFIVANGSMWQGTTVTWVDAYKIQKDQIIPMPELSQKKTTPPEGLP